MGDTLNSKVFNSLLLHYSHLKKQKMNEMKLMEILALVGEVHSDKWATVKAIVEAMPDVIIMDKRWNSIVKQEKPDLYPLDLAILDEWRTYDGECISLVFHNENGVLICNVRIYDGYTLDGRSFSRKALRFAATLLMPVDFVKHIEPGIRYALREHAEDAYKAHLRAEKQEWVELFINRKINQ